MYAVFIYIRRVYIYVVLIYTPCIYHTFENVCKFAVFTYIRRLYTHAVLIYTPYIYDPFFVIFCLDFVTAGLQLLLLSAYISNTNTAYIRRINIYIYAVLIYIRRVLIHVPWLWRGRSATAAAVSRSVTRFPLLSSSTLPPPPCIHV